MEGQLLIHLPSGSQLGEMFEGRRPKRRPSAFSPSDSKPDMCRDAGARVRLCCRRYSQGPVICSRPPASHQHRHGPHGAA
jgi:hypothetical protein